MPADRQSSRPWIGPVIGVVLVLTAVGGLVARSVYQPTANASVPPSVAPPVPNPSTTGTPVPPPGSPQVKLSADAALSPYGAAVQPLLQVYFNAINSHNYVEWESTGTSVQIQANPQGAWQDNYRSSQDGSMYVYRINAAAPGQLRVLLTFTSLQDPAKAPHATPFHCLDWHVVLSLADGSTGWKVDSNQAGLHPIAVQCANG